MTEPWDRPRTRLAIKMAPDRDAPKTALGWALLALTPQQRLAEGEDRIEGSHLDAILRRYRALMAQHPGAGGVTLYRYNPKSFRRSRAAREGMTHEEHNRVLDDVARALRAEGVYVEILPA